MQYAAALKVSTTSPCTNVPIHCMLCTPGSTGQPITIWKYNFLHQSLIFNHTDDKGELPPLTFDFLKSAHISFKEAEGLGVIAGKVEEIRDEWGLPPSDAYRPPTVRWETMKLENQAPRKRGISHVLKASSGSGGTPAKTQRTEPM